MLYSILLFFSIIIVDPSAPAPHDTIFSSALQNGINTSDTVYIKPGTLVLTKYPNELRSGNLNNLKIVGSGINSTTILGKSSTGFDVLQINKSSNLTISDLTITAQKTSSTGNGVNGISMTNGVYNVTIERVRIHSLPFIQNATWYNGGKGITIQSGSGNTISDNINITNVTIENCPIGFGLDCNPKLGIIRSVTFDRSQIKNCLLAFAPSYTEPDNNLDLQILNNTIYNCSRFIFNSRANNVIYSNNYYRQRTTSTFYDVYPYPNNHIILSGSNLCELISNTVISDLRYDNAFLAMKAPNSCQNCVITNNLFHTNTIYGFSQLPDGIVSSIFSCNNDFGTDEIYEPSFQTNNTIE